MADAGIPGENIAEGAYADVYAWAPGQVVKLFKAGLFCDVFMVCRAHFVTR
jgi:hypothetical protein